MKRTISVILTVLLLVLSAFALVACDGGIKTEEDWNKALDYLANCDAVTITVEETIVEMNHLVDKDKVKHKLIVSFDAKQGAVYSKYDYTSYFAIGLVEHRTHGEDYFIADGNEIRHYSRKLGEFGTDWEGQVWKRYENANEVTQEQRNRYLRAEYSSETKYMDLTDLKYSSFYQDKNKFVRTEEEEYYGTTIELTFSNGRLTKVSYERIQKSSGPKDSRKYTITIKYKANISVPNNLPKVN